MKHKVVIASSNPGKCHEIEDSLSEFNFEFLLQNHLGITSVEETGATFVENAILKARHACLHSGYMALADDSGLVVDALDGAPGLYSARYAGPDCDFKDNINLLLDNMRDVPQAKRSATFYCSLVWMRDANDTMPLICHGAWRGEITLACSGQHGFGYDPVFYCPEKQCTAAELDFNMKQSFSHRGRAMRLLTSMLPSFLNGG